ncbi:MULTISPECIES: hypothetical protein [unclassified Mesorhizobium]|uniref:hypothetical protein n=1 Tax=unclassified Mesorhizobium TaxID=325217 RepID=UPI000F75AFC3|nr:MULTISPECIES: hypothetical protein [unclassified Mesorhizobium]TGT54188.1 hypothetical protein EN813_043945 [Mesorhizobium sp. M00.F.Ca.ET.170.01.1.1]AZO09898.1 hypothetical protein EJ074_12940 [Mesorhizobium sp. M3A.F.Ca.ET.080.04.2.1]RWE24477.1 MAG: hypothetical protein EOS41_16095 [Mesorhizobium sp.]RWE33512.1 MAG: hypothetical protein EOS77_11880 [Mesorhizobium sp.]RWF23081.1 MAG: hypothetical protein EOS64_12625 [Mesorhizobium sp.]
MTDTIFSYSVSMVVADPKALIGINHPPSLVANPIPNSVSVIFSTDFQPRFTAESATHFETPDERTRIKVDSGSKLGTFSFFAKTRLRFQRTPVVMIIPTTPSTPAKAPELSTKFVARTRDMPTRR